MNYITNNIGAAGCTVTQTRVGQVARRPSYKQSKQQSRRQLRAAPEAKPRVAAMSLLRAHFAATREAIDPIPHGLLLLRLARARLLQQRLREARQL